MSYPLVEARSSQRQCAVQKRDGNSRRARLISQIVFPPREFSSYFHSTLRRSEPPCLVTSHGRSSIVPRVIRTYPSMVPSLRWNPYVECASDVQTEDPSYYECEECTGMTPPPMRNVTTFCNQFTMTPKVADASCGICRGVSPPPRVCEAAVTARESKRVDVGECVPRRRAARYQEPVRDVDDVCLPSQSSSVWSFCKSLRRKKSQESTATRPSSARSDRDFDDERPKRRSKVLYNEGISDSAAECGLRCQDATWQQQHPARCWPELDNYIPHSHTFKSKYHHRCQDEPTRRYRCGNPEDELRYKGLCPRTIIRRAQGSKGSCGRYQSPPRSPTCGPRKLLASERDIDAYMSQTTRDRGRRDSDSKNISSYRNHDHEYHDH